MHRAGDPLLNTERGIVLAERGNLEQAERAWRMVLEDRPLYPPAYTNLASLVMEKKDLVGAAQLVDDALRRGAAHPDVLRRAIQLSRAAEPEGIARASRVATLASALVERAPNDAWARLVLARALALSGDKASAVKRLSEVEELAAATSFAAEAQRGRLALEDPQVSLEIDSVLRAAYQAAIIDLETIAGHAAMSVRTLSRRFRDYVGTTPLELLARIRVDRARRLLETTDLRVDRVAQQAGFGSEASLRHHFGRVVGIPPQKYRSSYHPRRPDTLA